MRVLRTAIFALLVAGMLAFASGAGAALIGVYRNSMENKGQLAQILKLSGERCARGGSEGAFTITIGKATKECSYRTPVLGRDLEIGATMRLLSKPQVPKSVQRSAYLALDLRAGGGARYQLAVYPLQDKAQIRKVRTDGTIEYLDIEKQVAGIGGAEKPNQLRLSAFNITSGEEKGSCQLLAYVGGQLVAEANDPGAGELSGRASGFSLGSAKVAKGAGATVDDVVVRIPSPY
ncbi:MAG TPA: hypothetical protein VH042_06550 [Solirubrobacterales bacterium]|jgi:hypothetical protein|nr:hypothetical protein [Solirubrobacterales bacterium]